MSRENAEIVRSVYEAVARRDGVSPFEVYASDIEWDVGPRRSAMFGAQVYRGHEGVRHCWRDMVSAFGEIDMRVAELIDAGDCVLAVIHERELGRASGVAVEGYHYAVWTLRNGKVVRMRIFEERPEAERDVGLAE
jgi:ketosteroid isomerase-like protein